MTVADYPFTTGIIRPFPLYATGARDARGPDLLDRCVVCQWKPTPAERVADLAGGAGLVHVAGCVDKIRTAGVSAESTVAA
jgi:hypothetical protein